MSFDLFSSSAIETIRTYSLGQGNISFTDLLQLSLPLSTIGDCGVLVDLGLGERELLESSDDIVIGNSRHV